MLYKIYTSIQTSSMKHPKNPNPNAHRSLLCHSKLLNHVRFSKQLLLSTLAEQDLLTNPFSTMSMTRGANGSWFLSDVVHWIIWMGNSRSRFKQATHWISNIGLTSTGSVWCQLFIWLKPGYPKVAPEAWLKTSGHARYKHLESSNGHLQPSG